MRHIYYKFDPVTEIYERVNVTTKDKILIVVRHLLTGVVIGVGLFCLLIYFVELPTHKILRNENNRLISQYKVLSKQLDKITVVLDDIQERDNNMYRVIFQADPIPASIRKAGYGGTNRYEELMSLSDAKLVVSTSQKMDILSKQLYIQSKSLDEIVTLMSKNEERLQCIPAIQPVSNKDLKRTASGYGMRIDPVYKTPKFHAGMDFAAPIGTDIYATGNGRVSYSGWKQGYGNTVMIDHGYGYETLYGHMSEILVPEGKEIKRGEIIGLVGSTGKSVGPHLHYEVRYKGTPENPQNYYYMDLTPEEYDRMIQISTNAGQMFD
ncbi:MAG: M23 family metallopeptidase [Candidatus Azobacteroides sp.]|nr:M23 family metallopeptidase [Candidatus Azobacteroides sp.]